MKKLEIKYLIIVILVSLIFILGVISYTIKNQTNISFFSKIPKDFINYTAYMAEVPINKIGKIINKYVEYNDIYKKYEKLKEDASKTDFIMTKYSESLKVISELESMLDLDTTLLEEKHINATIINRNLDYWFDKITIDKGSKNGVEKGDAVITQDGLIGKVISVSYVTSDIKLLTSDDINNKLSVKIKINDEYIYAILTGYDKKNKEFILKGIEGNKKIDENSEVITTGYENNFPSGLLVGYVSKEEMDHFKLERTIKIKSKVDFDGIRFVTVLKRK